MNVVCLVGRLIADPELRQTPQGTSVCSFVISVQRPNAKKDENGFYPSDLIRCVAWRTTGEFVQRYFVKGSMIGLSGAIQVNRYTDRDTGKKLSSFEVVANNVYFVESRNSASRGMGTSQGYTQPAPRATENRMSANSFSTGDLDGFSVVSTDDGDLPF